MAQHNYVYAPANENNLVIWELELANWHSVIDAIEDAIVVCQDVSKNSDVIAYLRNAEEQATLQAARVSLYTGRLRRSLSDKEGN